MGEQDNQRISRGQWMALAAALLGWMFDGLEQGLFPLVARPALTDLLGLVDEKQIGRWFAVATAGFLVGAATGGVLFGWLGDRIGRVRAMTLSVLTYATFSGLCGVATSAEQVAGLRFLSALGMGGEWSLGVALVMEVWPDKSRALLAGLIGAAANVGYLLIALLGLGLGKVLPRMEGWLLGIGLPENWVASLVAHSGWRILMLLGAAPAVLTFFIQLFVPESGRWRHEQTRGSTSHWATRDLLGVGLGALAAFPIIYLWSVDHPLQLFSWLASKWHFFARSVYPYMAESTAFYQYIAEHSLTIRVTGSCFALLLVTLGYLYPVMRYLQRAGSASTDRARTWAPTVGRMLLGASLSGVALLGTWASLQWAPTWADKLTDGSVPEAKAYTQIWAALGAIVGTISAAVVGNWIGRRVTYTILCVGSLTSALALFQLNNQFGPAFLISVFLAGCITASFYGWLPLYLPELFRTSVRATCQGFSYNFGRILAAVGVLQTGSLMGLFQGGYPQACSIMSLVYLVGLGLIWLAPETRGKPLPE